MVRVAQCQRKRVEETVRIKSKKWCQRKETGKAKGYGTISSLLAFI